MIENHELADKVSLHNSGNSTSYIDIAEDDGNSNYDNENSNQEYASEIGEYDGKTGNNDEINSHNLPSQVLDQISDFNENEMNHASFDADENDGDNNCHIKNSRSICKVNDTNQNESTHLVTEASFVDITNNYKPAKDDTNDYVGNDHHDVPSQISMKTDEVDQNDIGETEINDLVIEATGVKKVSSTPSLLSMKEDSSSHQVLHQSSILNNEKKNDSVIDDSASNTVNVCDNCPNSSSVGKTLDDNSKSRTTIDNNHIESKEDGLNLDLMLSNIKLNDYMDDTASLYADNSTIASTSERSTVKKSRIKTPCMLCRLMKKLKWAGDLNPSANNMHF